MVVVKGLGLFLLIVFSLLPVDASSLRPAVRNTGEPVRWDRVGYFLETKNPPPVMVQVPFPSEGETANPGFRFPPSHIPVLLQLQLSPDPGTVNRQNLDALSRLFTVHKNISHLSLAGWEKIEDFKRLAYTVKQIASLARGTRPGIRIALACPPLWQNRELLTLIRTLTTNPETSPYFDAIFPAPPLDEDIRRAISVDAPHIRFWETVCLGDTMNKVKNDGGSAASRLLSCLLESNPFEKPGTSLLVLPVSDVESLYAPLLRFSEYLTHGLYRDPGGIAVTYPGGKSSRLPLFYRTADHAPLLFPGGSGKGKVKIALPKGVYKKVQVKNLVTGDEGGFKVYRNSTALYLKLEGDLFAVRLIPRKDKSAGHRYSVNVTGKYRLSADEIIARVRAWKARQKTRLKSYTADMTTSLRLRIANMKETFDLTIEGPVFQERDKPFDWVWQGFYLNGVKWKSKRVPKIPLLQPEKVNIMPLDIGLTEEYDYSSAGETGLEGRRAYVVDFKPQKEHKATALHRGRLWIDAETFAVLREHLIQLNLKGEVLSNVETRYFKPVPGEPGIHLPLSVKGQQVFSTAGRITNVEREVTLSGVKINPQDFYTRREEAYASKSQMVRDTRKGLRYLLKDKKSGTRKVEWEAKKSQFFGVLGGFYDSSIAYPIPLLGFNYMNFNLGGKGRQVNVLFGGAMLTANYSDPAFLGTRMDVGANLIAVAFPLTNRVYSGGTGEENDLERLKRWPFRFQVNAGFPLGAYLKYSTSLFFEYEKFSLAKTTGEGFILPPDTLVMRWRNRFTFNIKGFRLSLWGDIARRSRWQYWGLPGNNDFNPDRKSFYRWQAELDKNFFLSPFSKVQLTAGYYDGSRLDRFSAYKFGFFNELKMHGYMSGVVQATRAFILNLSYAFSVGKAFRLEFFYDSSLATNPVNEFRNTYFSGAAIAGTMNIPGLKGILRFEAGMPVVNNGVKGLMVYFIFLKMF